MITFLLDTPMFGDLDASELSQIVHVMQVRTLPAGAQVFREGEPGDAWYVVFDGEVEVLKAGRGGSDRRVTTLGPRACFGEMAILDGSPRSATVRTTRPTTAFRFPRMEFNGLLSAGTLAAYKLVYQIALVLVARQRSTTRSLVELMAEDDATLVRQGLAPLVEQSAVTE
ncbi:MAG: cyclic nucleotide-binding domain-containing protein [Alphaproteobacteria bacterium]|nr:cyclic nucleotide-binding domain-containing protein [Alphaproteobacteria bacterium]MCB9690388.1 cyclic nucleotide-binding domain-containing protein [Alphaproteobacteria bacterium]